MKKLLILLLIILLARITTFSSTTLTEIKQDSIVYTSDLKYANLIFAEHDKFLKENSLLKNQIDNYKHLNETLVEIDSLRLNQIQEFNALDQYRLKQIDNLEIDIKAKNKTIRYWQIGSITISIGLIILLLQ